MFQRRWWAKLYRREVRVLTPADLRRLVAAKATSFRGRRASRAATAAAAGSDIGSDLDLVRDSGTRLTMAFSGDEALQTELAAEGILDRLASWPNLELHDLPGSDHTLRSVAAQRAAAELLDSELERVLAGWSRRV
jgi:hypothetical protein